MTEKFHGGCLCGAVRFVAAVRPRVLYCHCGMCRRATGGPFAVLAWVPKASLLWESDESRAIRRSSPIAARSFRGCCGTPLTLEYDDENETALHVGTFDEPQLLSPQYHYGVECRLPWVATDSVLPESDTRERW